MAKAASRAKRPHSPDHHSPLTVPTGDDCTRHNFFAAQLTDRQRLCWALQTETRLRLAKVEGRARASNVAAAAAAAAGDSSTGSLLQSDYLIDVYAARPSTSEDLTAGLPPTPRAREPSDPLARDRYAFQCKAIPALQESRDADESLATLTPIQVKDVEQDQTLRERGDAPPVPPNRLYFEIVLEAFMGYKIPTYNSADPTMPRASIMGGAVVAALSSFRDTKVAALFKKNGAIFKELKKKKPTDEDLAKYKKGMDELVAQLHDHFLHEEKKSTKSFPKKKKSNEKESSNNSPFCDGDADIFLQASPFTRALSQTLAGNGMDSFLQNHISPFLGGCDIVQDDLIRFSSALCKDYLEQEYKSYGAFVYAVAKNGLSFMLAKDDYSEVRLDTVRWARTSQLIMLNERADLLGALLDFDLSVVSCAYDGTSVYITPRAAFSLLTLNSFVTPFCLQEERNRKRVSKYYKRGFTPYLLDPNCLHLQQCENINALIQRNPFTEPPLDRKMWTNYGGRHASSALVNARWRSKQLRKPAEYEEILDNEVDWEERELCCHSRGTNFPSFRGNGRQITDKANLYTIALFEKTENHAIDFFSKYWNWSEQDREEVNAIERLCRFACLPCRNAYALHLVLEQSPISLETVDDSLRGDLAFMFSRGFNGDFNPSWYSGGAFSSLRVRNDSRTIDEAYMLLRAQSIAELGRHILKHGSPVCYVKRFTYGKTLDVVFEQASKVIFPETARPPIGLNPERFIARCDECGEWLHGCEFGARCESCDESKPSVN